MGKGPGMGGAFLGVRPDILSFLAGSVTTSQAWRGWEQVWESHPPWQHGVRGWGGVTLPQPLSSLSSDITVICPWEAFSHLELHELAQYGII